ncbi:MAG TPA: efflux RND transporter periplasmic adaptor subunit [Opitutaceae bacterium]|nr:efflux RND transporter periplasmic adaptor subunit [Opitutaceae bacterium]
MFRIESIARRFLFLGLFLSVTLGVRAQAGTTPDPLTTISRGSLRSILAPRHDLKLSSPAAGVVEKLYVSEGSRVATGDALLSLDSQQETAEVAQAQATLRGIEAEYERAASELTRAEALFRDKILADKQYEEYRGSALVLKSRRDHARATLELAQARLNNRTVRSPIDGICLKLQKSIGEAVERFEPIATVIDASVLRLTIYSDARLLGVFALGQTMTIEVQPSAQKTVRVPGKLIHADPIIDSSGTFRLIIEIIPSDDAIAGLPATLVLPPTATARNK